MLKPVHNQLTTYIVRDHNLMVKYNQLIKRLTNTNIAGTPFIKINADNITEQNDYIYVPNVAGAAYSATYAEHDPLIDFQTTTLQNKKRTYNHGNEITLNTQLIQSISLNDDN